MLNLHSKRHRCMPPPPHDPRDRVLLDVIEGWEIRVFEPGSRMERYFSDCGFDHLQLWHAPTGFSLLTPSRLTEGRFEVFPLGGWKYSASDYRILQEIVRQTVQIDLPRRLVIETLLEVFIECSEAIASETDSFSNPLLPCSPGHS
jgi:hypothetical protein